MSEVAHNAEREFWQPPAVSVPVVLEPAAEPGLVEACDRCETEFIPGSNFCHGCGAERSQRTAKHPIGDGMRAALAWFRHLEFHYMERWMVGLRQQMGLPTA